MSTAVGLSGTAFADAPNPDPGTQAIATVHGDGTADVTISGTWTWAGQTCAGRYAEGWAVDWWGISSSKAPASNFTLTQDSLVTPGAQLTPVNVTSVGSIKIPVPPHSPPGTKPTYFHLAKYYAGENVNSPSTCTDLGSGHSRRSTGSWSASAFYPSGTTVPDVLCVNMYDEHGRQGRRSGSANDFNPLRDDDNSIQTNSFNPDTGQGGGSSCAVVEHPE